MDPVRFIIENTVRPLQYADLEGQPSDWDKLVTMAGGLPATTVIGLASQWNALIYGPAGDFVPGEEARILGHLLSPRMALKVLQARILKMARESWTMPFPPPVLTRWQLRVLMQLALRDGVWDPENDDGLSGDDLAWILLGISDHMHGTAKRRGVLQLLTEMLAVWDISHQRDIGPGLTRTCIMLYEIAPKRGLPLDLRDLFLQAVGIPAEDYFVLALGASALASELGTRERPGRVSLSGAVDLPNLTVPRLKGKSAVPSENVQRFLEALSADPSAFKAKLSGVGQIQTDFSVLRRSPLLRMGPGEDGEPLFRLLDRILLLDKLSDGAFYATVAGGEALGLKPDTVPSLWGNLFEGYVDELILNSRLAPSYEPSPALMFHGTPGEGADGVIVTGDAIVVLECKVSPLTVPARSGSDARRMVADLLMKFVGDTPRANNR